MLLRHSLPAHPSHASELRGFNQSILEDSESEPDMEPQHISEARRGDEDPGPADEAPRGTGKARRIGRETRGLFEDFAAWVELRLRLAQLDVQGYIRQKIDEAALRIALAVAGFLSGLFALVTLALFAGWLFGHPAWGFLAVTGLLLLWTGLLYIRHRRMAARGAERMPGSLLSGAASQNGEHEPGEE